MSTCDNFFPLVSCGPLVSVHGLIMTNVQSFKADSAAKKASADLLPQPLNYPSPVVNQFQSPGNSKEASAGDGFLLNEDLHSTFGKIRLLEKIVHICLYCNTIPQCFLMTCQLFLKLKSLFIGVVLS